MQQRRDRRTRFPSGRLGLAIAAAGALALLPACEESTPAGGPDAGQNHSIRLADDVGLDMLWIPAGEFVMGSPSDETGRDADEAQHTVRVSRGFWISKYEVTQDQYNVIMGSNPSHYVGDDNPVERVSWAEAKALCGRLETRLGHGRFRLPTEAEWEYACRAGTTTPFCSGGADTLGAVAWYDATAGGTTHTVGAKTPNAFGLYDTHGNVWEWCEDWYGGYPGGSVTDPQGPAAGPGRVVRGGSHTRPSGMCRSANRDWIAPEEYASYLGFRIVRTTD